MKIICNVPYINQMPKWPTGCESVSTVMLLNYLGIDISVDEFISYLPCEGSIYKNSQVFGNSPDKYFIGSPYDNSSYGCYAKVIEKTVNTIAEEKQLPIKAINLSGVSPRNIELQYIQNNYPVIYWATIDLKPSIIGPSWNLSESENTQFVWKSNEHCMLLTGFDEEHYFFHDPWNNNPELFTAIRSCI